MKTFNKFKFMCKEFVDGLFQSSNKAAYHFIACFFCLCLLGFVFVIYFDANRIVANINGKIRLSIYLKDDITDEALENIKSRVQSCKNVRDYTYISKEEAKEKAQNMSNKELQGILQSIDTSKNPFPASFVLNLKDNNIIKSTAKQFEGMEGIEDNGIKYGEDYVNKVLVFIKFIEYISVAIFVVLFFISIFFMMSIINLILSTKKDEYHVMDMVGASKFQIKFPFYMQGIFLGIVSSLLSFLIIQFSLYYVESKFQAINRIFNIPLFASIQNYILIYILGMGIFVGILATSLSLRRFVKVSKTNRKKKKLRNYKAETSAL